MAAFPAWRDMPLIARSQLFFAFRELMWRHREEMSLVQTQRWILQQARAYGLGSSAERPFAIAADAPPIASDAPGSPARRLGSVAEHHSPLDSWLDALFGPGS